MGEAAKRRLFCSLTSPFLWGKLQNLSPHVAVSMGEVVCTSFVVNSSTGKCFVQAL